MRSGPAWDTYSVMLSWGLPYLFRAVYFDSVLAMEHAGMVQMFKTIEETGLKGFLIASDSVYESAVVEFFANAKVLAGTVKETVDEMRIKFSGTDAPFRAPSKKKQMKTKFHLLHHIVAKALCSKAGYFDLVTNEKFDLMDRNTEKQQLGATNLASAILPHLTQQRAINNTRQGLNTYPNKLGWNANRLEKGDVLAHLTSFKQTSESNIQTKRLSKRSPTTLTSILAVYCWQSKKIRFGDQ
ncbi:jordan protein TnpA [Dorcoceras hygrometricum]|uniref:Jordan protein TnpA n=1 Tax=Dorcoceras hygrometricum TaxID=472368 RepID=A0A2Z7ALR5_9LAMI|nr:jordan protein TnpA [Dorcoceras hygrometricum]